MIRFNTICFEQKKHFFPTLDTLKTVFFKLNETKKDVKKFNEKNNSKGRGYGTPQYLFIMFPGHYHNNTNDADDYL